MCCPQQNQRNSRLHLIMFPRSGLTCFRSAHLAFSPSDFSRSLVTSPQCICPMWSWRIWASRERSPATLCTFTCVAMLTRRAATRSRRMWTGCPYTTPSHAVSPSTPPTACWSVTRAPVCLSVCVGCVIMQKQQMQTLLLIGTMWSSCWMLTSGSFHLWITLTAWFASVLFDYLASFPVLSVSPLWNDLSLDGRKYFLWTHSFCWTNKITRV